MKDTLYPKTKRRDVMLQKRQLLPNKKKTLYPGIINPVLPLPPYLKHKTTRRVIIVNAVFYIHGPLFCCVNYDHATLCRISLR
jgi:hypothetical protein